MQYIIICFISLTLYSPALADTLQGKVVKIADGDTATILNDQGQKHRIRLTGIEQIKKGLAWHYKYYQMEQYEEDRRLYSEAELEARKKQIGMWKDEEPMAPWKWRR